MRAGNSRFNRFSGCCRRKCVLFTHPVGRAIIDTCVYGAHHSQFRLNPRYESDKMCAARCERTGRRRDVHAPCNVCVFVGSNQTLEKMCAASNFVRRTSLITAAQHNTQRSAAWQNFCSFAAADTTAAAAAAAGGLRPTRERGGRSRRRRECEGSIRRLSCLVALVTSFFHAVAVPIKGAQILTGHHFSDSAENAARPRSHSSVALAHFQSTVCLSCT